MMRPEKMKQLEITVLQSDVDNVLKFLGTHGVLQFSYRDKARKKSDAELALTKKLDDALGNLKNAAAYLGVELPEEPGERTEKSSEADDKSLALLVETVSALQNAEYKLNLEKERLGDRLTAFAGFEGLALDVPLDKINDFSFLNLKIGRLEQDKQEKLKANLGDRALVLPLGSDEVLVASSRANRFALDTELSKENWTPAPIPEEAQAQSEETVNAMRERLAEIEQELAGFSAQKAHQSENFGLLLKNLYASYLMSQIIDDIKGRLVSTASAFVLAGWIPARHLNVFAGALGTLTEGRIACAAFDPWEVEAVKQGKEKIPVQLKHGSFFRAFEPLVFSYGAPLYGSLDPTPISAVFFTLLFSIMFGDVGQGLCLFLLGLLVANRKIKLFSSYRNFAGPLKIIGIAAIVTGFLYGSVFSNEDLLRAPTEAFTLWLSQTGAGRLLNLKPVGKILELMPEKGSITKLFYFFGFTLAVGFILNSIGLLFNIIDNFVMRRYQKALLSKNGLAGLVFFWYAVFIVIRGIVGGGFQIETHDIIVLIAAIFLIAAGPFIWALCTKDKKLFEEGLFACIMEAIVEILETVSGYISNSVSFLRVGAFALSHTILSFIIFKMADIVGDAALGTLWSGIIIIFGNLLIIVLEGMIVAIQIVRLQYYEFFSKFWTETGAKWTPFKFRKKAD
ncbi:MAG: V-type ATP synthase subunit I [Spirochaetaceae bacterium]|jgi:V/A-type H+-transporting ATPase subunit I|nr:V-type ATP synthase subunit I [Spirochaetaceae bacterium]